MKKLKNPDREGAQNMKLIDQSVELWEQPEGEIGIYKQIERAARLCYKSEDKTTDNSYTQFISMLEGRKHKSPFEHGTVYLKFFLGSDYSFKNKIWDIINSPYSRTVKQGITYYITTNYRAILENNALDVLDEYLCEPTEYHIKRISVHITTSIGIGRELNRHRCHSICEESTRYCNYTKDKFDNCITFIKPNWADMPTGQYIYWDECWCDANREKIQLPVDKSIQINALLHSWVKAEVNYNNLINSGLKPQQARDVLPLATKTELIHTAFEDDWEEFFKLRCSPAAHPMMQELANKIKQLIHKEDVRKS